MKRILIFLALGLSLLIPQISKSQASVHINGTPRTSGYPSIKVDFTAKKSNGDQLKITDFSGTDVWVTDNGVKKFGTVECPDPGVSKFSTILIIDISGSMKDKVEGTKTKMDLAKLAANEWIKNLPNGRFECAIMAFHQDVYILSDFTELKAQLFNSIKSDTLQAVAVGTDFNSAMLYDVRFPAQPGALRVAERAKYAPYIIFLTDGGHSTNAQGRSDVWRSEIVNKANELGAKIYTVTMTPPDQLAPSQVDDIYAISTKVYWDRRSTASIIATYEEILNEVQYTAPPPPCIFTYEGDCNSSDKLLLYVDNPYVNGYDSTSFTVPSNLLPYLEYSAEFKVPFLNVPKGTPQTRNFAITPKQNFVRFTGPPIIDNPNFKILNPDAASWSNLTVNKDVPLTITVEYTEPPGDSICRQAQIEFVGTACKDKIGTVSAGWIIARPIDFGSRKINTEHTLTYTTVFCNKSCFDINIDDMYIGGGAANKFSLKSAKYTGNLTSGQCIDLTFAFTPDKAELFESQFNVVVGGKVYSSPIRGTGTGNAELEAVNSIKFNPNASCTNPVVENTITVKNVGALPLSITNISVEDGGNQAGIFVHNDPLPPPIDPDQTVNVKVQFKPTTAKTYSGYNLKIESNAASNPIYYIALTATMDSVGFATDKPSVDLGVLCPSETGTQTITLDPQGSDVPFDVTATAGGSLTAADISGGTASWSFTPGNSQQVSISVAGKTEGIFNGNIQFKDSKCNRTIDIPVKWEIAQPDIDDITVNFVANIPQTNVQNVIITNNSKRDFSISDTIIRCSEFFIEQGSLVLPALVTKNGGTLSFKVVYGPTKSGSESCYLVLAGDPCNYSDSVRLSGAATSARADIVIKEHRGIIGEVVTIPIDIEKGQNVPGSGTKTITTEVTYDNTLLDPQDFLSQFKGKATIVGGNKLRITGIPIAEINGNQPGVENMKFRVLANSPNTSCDLMLTNSVSDAPGQLNFSPINGKFILDIVTADIKVGNVTAFPGQKIGIPITITNFKNYKPAVNKTLNIDLKFNKTILECNDGSITCNVVTNDRIARIPIPLAGVSGADLPVISKQFRTMLGLAETTPLEIVGVSFETGELDANITNGTLSLEICKEGGDRLFDANTPAAMIYSPEPNPVNSATVIKYQTPEQGMTKVFISDLIGNHVLDLVNTVVDPGVYSVIFDGSVLTNGVYIITIKTETQLVSKIFSVVN